MDLTMIRLALVLFVAAAGWAAEPPETAFAQSVEPFLKRYCAACHSSANKTAGLDVMALRGTDRWYDVLEKTRSGEMPPIGMPRGTAQELATVTRWMEAQIERTQAASAPDPGRVTARRLNKVEYTNTVRDLLGISLQAADDFPNDDSGYGFRQ
jgi:mono/diheme cytochrome c family protein